MVESELHSGSSLNEWARHTLSSQFSKLLHNKDSIPKFDRTIPTMNSSSSITSLIKSLPGSGKKFLRKCRSDLTDSHSSGVSFNDSMKDSSKARRSSNKEWRSSGSTDKQRASQRKSLEAMHPQDMLSMLEKQASLSQHGAEHLFDLIKTNDISQQFIEEGDDL